MGKGKKTVRHFSFTGGIHPREGRGGKAAAGEVPIRAIDPPHTVAVSLLQHVGPPCKSLVRPGDTVRLGQKIGEPTGRVGAPVHASVSGKVKGIKPRILPSGASVDCVIIDNDGKNTPWEGAAIFEDPLSAEKPALLRAIREAGLVGLGGAAFPLEIKLTLPEGKTADTLILNGAECEPYLCGDDRMMLEHAQDIWDGAQIAAYLLGAKEILLGIEDNKPRAIQSMRACAAGKVCVLKTKYPQGGEKQLIRALTGRQVPQGGLPVDAGCVVMNVSTAAALSAALRRGKPVTHRVITVAGWVQNPCNLLVPVGTDIDSVIAGAGGALPEAGRVILGGPMMGMPAYNGNTPTVKGLGGVVLLPPEKENLQGLGNCIRCGSCLRACPMHLAPMELYALARKGRYRQAVEREGALNCIECGSCAYECPAKLPLAQMIRVAKRAGR